MSRFHFTGKRWGLICDGRVVDETTSLEILIIIETVVIPGGGGGLG